MNSTDLQNLAASRLLRVFAGARKPRCFPVWNGFSTVTPYCCALDAHAPLHNYHPADSPTSDYRLFKATLTAAVLSRSALHGDFVQSSTVFRHLSLKALFLQPKLLMLDEPTNHLDLDAVRTSVALPSCCMRSRL